MRVLVGFLVAPLAPALVAWLLSLAPNATSVRMPSDYARLFIAFGYPVVLVFGVPAYLYFRRRNWLKAWQVILAGAFAGALSPAAAVIFLWSSAPSAEYLLVATGRVGPFIPFGMAVGSVCAASFWLIALTHVATRQSTPSRSAA